MNLDTHTLSDPWRMQICMLPISRPDPEDDCEETTHGRAARIGNRNRAKATESAIIAYVFKNPRCDFDEIVTGTKISKDRIRKVCQFLLQDGTLTFITGSQNKRYWSLK